MSNIYIIDNDSLIELKRYPSDVFVSLWVRIEELVDAGRLIAPHEVLRELAVGDDVIEKWAKGHKVMFVDLDKDQTEALQVILRDYPRIHDPEKTSADADPMLVALCQVLSRRDRGNKYCIVTQESLKGPGSQKLPNVCKELGVETIKLVELFKRERFRF